MPQHYKIFQFHLFDDCWEAMYSLEHKAIFGCPTSREDVTEHKSVCAYTGCGKLTSFFEYEMPYEKGS
jgi:hypothetical protein